MLGAHLLHNEPNRASKFDVFGVGLIMLGSMIVISFGMYVYCNVLKSPFNLYLQVNMRKL